jgi:hypothetical protein
LHRKHEPADGAGRPSLADLSRFDRREEGVKLISVKVDITSIRMGGTPHDHYIFMCGYLDTFTGLAET